MLKKLNLTFLGLLLMNSICVHAQSAEELIDKYFSKIGGKDKWNAIQSMVSTGTTQVMGQDFPYSVRSKAPNMNRLELTALGQTIIQAYDGKTAWTINPFQGSGKPEPMSPELGKLFSEQNQMRPALLDFGSKGMKVALLGKEIVNAISCDRVELTHKEGDKDYYFFDPTSALLLMIRKTPTSGEASGKPVESYLSNYKVEQGINLPHTIETKIQGKTFTKIVTNTVKLNVPVESKIFAFPVQ